MSAAIPAPQHIPAPRGDSDLVSVLLGELFALLIAFVWPAIAFYLAASVAERWWSFFLLYGSGGAALAGIYFALAHWAALSWWGALLVLAPYLAGAAAVLLALNCLWVVAFAVSQPWH